MTKPTDWILDLFFPTRCILCREPMPPGRPGFCPVCRETLPANGVGHIKGDFFSGCVAALRYDGPVRDAILRYKFGGVQAYAHAFGELVAERIYSEYFGKYDLLTWAPLSPDRLRRRGYDQAGLLAQNAAARLRQTAVPTLRKRRGVGPQSLTNDREKRRANIAGAYTVIDPAAVRGRRVLLIDDIVTTGSTLSECAKMLLLADAEDVMCAALAAATES